MNSNWMDYFFHAKINGREFTSFYVQTKTDMPVNLYSRQ